MKYLPHNTLAYWLSAPQYRTFDFSAVQMQSIAPKTRKFWENSIKANPDAAALDFYALNQVVSVIRQKFTLNEPLPAWAIAVMDDYTSLVASYGERLLHYLFLICTREARHAANYNKLHGPLMFDFVKDKVERQTLFNFFKHIAKLGEESAAVEFTKTGLSNPIGDYLQGLVVVFDQNWGGGYGGPPWANIARTALEFLKGNTTMEMMIDTAWTLAHNNGPMFNKGMLFANYTDRLKMILDVQRSGQIVESFLDPANLNALGNSNHTSVAVHIAHCKEAFPDAFGKYVDWEKVVPVIGDATQYAALLIKQQKVFPPPLNIKGIGPVKSVGKFDLLPGLAVQTYERMEDE